MEQVIILVDGNATYARTKFERLKKMFEGTGISVELTTEEIVSMSGAKTERAFLKITKEGG